jgi:ribosomal protein S18 acetylase RimI-like enzyme
LIDDLSWDSNFLGLKTGRLHCDREEQLLECLANIKGDHYQLIYVFSDTAIDVRPADCRLIDVGGQVTYSKSLEITRQSREQAHSEDSIGIYQGPDENESLHSNDPEGILTATWKQEHGTIDLLAVRQDSQGKGIGSKLLEHIENEAVKYSAHQIDVKTQMTNDAARRTYERNGYSLKESFYVYHLHLSSL